MLFMVYEDSRDIIKAYCVPDNYSSQSKLNAFAGGRWVATIAPNDLNEHMAGRHETGQVGFIIDNGIINGLSGFDDLELRDAETDILVYRRPNEASFIAQCVFRLETQLFPIWRIDAALKDKFRFWYQRIEQYSAETTRQILSFHSFGSLYSSGRIIYQNYDYYLRDNQKKTIVMQDPYCELAERLIVLNRLSAEAVVTLLGPRDVLVFDAVLGFVKDFSGFGEQELKKVLRNASPEALSVLSNPVVRQLTASTPDEVSGKTSVAQALRCLSEFEIIGQRREIHDFVHALYELLGLHGFEFQMPEDSPEIERVAANLRAVPWVEALLEKDLELYHHIKSAFDALPAKA